jgi:hypothetical protein
VERSGRGLLLGGAERADTKGFYGAAEPGKGNAPRRAAPPRQISIIQDELHLISGPLGTMAGLYETAIEALCVREVDGHAVRPKIVASTATVRRAQDQIQALFGRGADAASSRRLAPIGATRSSPGRCRLRWSPARLYLGIASQGRNPKVMMRRRWLALMGAAERCYREAGGHRTTRTRPIRT